MFQVVQADVTAIPNKDGSIDAAGMISGIGNKTRLSIILTPNNPTGLMLSEQELRDICEQTPENVLLFIDEAFHHEFALHAGGPNAIDLVKDQSQPVGGDANTFESLCACGAPARLCAVQLAKKLRTRCGLRQAPLT